MGSTSETFEDRAFLTMTEFARSTGEHYSTVARAVRAGRIPAVKRGGKWLIPRTYLVELESEAYDRVAEPGSTTSAAAAVALARAVLRGNGGNGS